MDKGYFVISLDFELMWGVLDVFALDKYKQRILNVHAVIPKILRLFKDYNIHATWATVGFLLCKSKEELLGIIPSSLPQYTNLELSSYHYFNLITGSPLDKLFFAPSLIEEIKNTPEQEIATHTLSHFYCMEDGQTAEDFRYDVKTSKKLFQDNGICVKSIIYPRNQCNEEYFPILQENGISIYRGNQDGWLYQSEATSNNLIKRLLRLIDCYINITGSNTYKADEICTTAVCNIKASRFLRPYSHKLRFFETLKINRIKQQMRYAAKNNEIFHLWWHPHNFGSDTQKNLDNLMHILKYYDKLRQEYNFKSLNMQEAAKLVKERR